MSASTVPTTERAERLAGLLAERDLDALLVTNLVNVRYLTGYTGTNGLAVVGRSPDLRRFVTDFRYVTQASEEVQGYTREIGETDLLESVGIGLPDGELRLGFDDNEMSVNTFERLRQLLPGRVTLVPAGGVVEALRVVKDADEVARIRAAAELADAALTRTLEGGGLVGRTERELALSLEFEMRQAGASGLSFPSIVASGPHGALPHAQPRDVEIARGSLVVIDWGAVLDGYCSDCTRTFAAGAEPNALAQDIYGVVLSAQIAALGAVEPGASGRAVDGIARDAITAAGYGDRFGHGLGHGVGLEVHEGPRLSKASAATLAPGNIVTVEPGIYVPGEAGVRIEDLVHVTAEGHEVLNGLPKDLTVV